MVDTEQTRLSANDNGDNDVKLELGTDILEFTSRQGKIPENFS